MGSEDPLFTWDLLWTGWYYNSLRTEDAELPSAEEIFTGGTLYNRGNFALGAPALDLSLRFLVTDKRLLPFEENDGRAGFNPAAGIYHYGSGSRLLYGVQNQFGLSARINNVWQRSIPYMESRQPMSRDLKPEPAARDTNETYLYLGLPHDFLPGFDLFASVGLDIEQNPAFGAGFGLAGDSMQIRLEGFYTQKTLPERSPSTWFSESPALPERDFQIHAMSLFFNSPNLGFAADWAYSETFAWGEGVYGNFSLRLGHRPWRFSLGGDGASTRFVDRSGAAVGAGFRLAARGEYFWPRSGLLRLQCTLRSPGLEEEFNRGNILLYYRPSAPSAAERRNNPNAFRFSRASLSVNRDARTPEKTIDTLNALAAFSFGTWSAIFTGTLNSHSGLDDNGGVPLLLTAPFLENFDSLRVSGELAWRPARFSFGSLNLSGRLGYTIRAERDDLWDLSINGSVRPGNWGRIGLRIASTDFPDRWNYTFSWRYTARL